MSYVDTVSIGSSSATITARPSVPRPIAQSPEALGDLGRAATEYAGAAAAFIDARHTLEDARARFAECMDRVSSTREQENV